MAGILPLNFGFRISDFGFVGHPPGRVLSFEFLVLRSHSHLRHALRLPGGLVANVLTFNVQTFNTRGSDDRFAAPLRNPMR